MSGITDFCRYMYILVCRCSLICVCDKDFGITPVQGITIGNYYYKYYYYVAHHMKDRPTLSPSQSQITSLSRLLPHAVTVGALRYVFLHPIEMFTFVTFINFKFTQIWIFILFVSNTFISAGCPWFSASS